MDFAVHKELLSGCAVTDMLVEIESSRNERCGVELDGRFFFWQIALELHAHAEVVFDPQREAFIDEELGAEHATTDETSLGV